MIFSEEYVEHKEKYGSLCIKNHEIPLSVMHAKAVHRVGMITGLLQPSRTGRIIEVQMETSE